MSGSNHILVAGFADVASLRRAWENDICKGRLAVPDDPAIALLAPVSVVLVLAGEELARLEARTVHRGGGWLGLQIGAAPDDARAAIEATLVAPPEPVLLDVTPELEVLEVHPEPALEPTPAAQPAAPADDGPPTERATADARPMALRYPDMSAPEKMQIALRGDRDGRLMVMKEANPNLLKFLLQNPRTTPQEIAALAANPGSPLDLLKLISDHPLLAQNEAIRVALVKNPRAPVPLVRVHLEKLSQGQLAQLGKSQHLRDEVRRLALKLVLNRR